MYLYFILAIQPVVKMTTGLTTRCIHDTAGCQRLNVCIHDTTGGQNKQPTDCKTGCTTGLTTDWMFVYTIQPVVQLVVKQVVSCKRSFMY